MILRLFKLAVALIVFLCLFVLSTALLTQMEFVHSFIGRGLGAVLESRTGIAIHLDRLHGNLWQRLSLDHVLVRNQQDTVFTCRNVSISWNPWALFRRQVEIDRLILEQPHLNICQGPDGTLNIAALFAKSSGEGGRFWKIKIDTLWLDQGSLETGLGKVSPLIPRRFHNLTLLAQFAAHGNKSDLQVHELCVESTDPRLRVLTLRLQASRSDSITEIEKFYLKTDHSTLAGNARWNEKRPPSLDVHVAATPLDRDEMRRFLPKALLQGRPNLDIFLHLRDQVLQIVAVAEQKEERVTLTAAAALNEKPTAFDGRIEFTNFHPDIWWQIADHSLISGDLSFSGRGWSTADADWKLDGRLQDCRIGRINIQDTQMAANVQKNSWLLEAQTKAMWGQTKSRLNFLVSDTISTFALQSECRRLNLAGIFGIDTLYSDLNFNCTADGQGTSFADLSGQMELSLSPSFYNQYPIDSVFSAMTFRDQRCRVDRLRLTSPVLDVTAHGDLDKGERLSIAFSGTMKEPDFIRELASADTLHVQGPFHGTIAGPLDSLFLNVKVDWHKAQFDAITADSVRGIFQLAIIPDHLDGRIVGRVRRGLVSILPIDSTLVAIHLFSDSLHCAAHAFVADSIEAKTRFQTYWGQRPIINIFPVMQVQLKDQFWNGGGTDSRIVVYDENFRFENFTLRCGEQRADLTGFFSWTTAESLALSWNRVQLAQLNKLLPKLPLLQGTASGDALMTGTADSPLVNATWRVDQGNVNGLALAGFQGSCDYKDEQAVWQSTIFRDPENRISFNGYLPLNLSLTNERDIVYYDRPFRANVKAENLDLGFLSYLSRNLRQVQGRLDCDLRLSNTLHDPQPSGHLHLRDGQVFIPKAGKKFQDILVDVQADSSRLHLNKLQINSGDGRISGGGTLDFSGEGLQTHLQQMDLSFRADNFCAIETRDVVVVLNGDVRLSNSFNEPRFDGDITVVRSRLYLPSLTNMNSGDVSTDRPMLMTLRQDSTLRPAALSSDSLLIKQLQNLRGSVKLEIPRNTWLRSPEMNIEISGKLNVVMNGAAFELFGVIEMVRGDYNIYGRRFEIQNGTIAFQGGNEINPVVELEAQHIFRSADKIKRALMLKVSGEILEPKLAFTLDNAEIAETDAIAYLVFGCNFDELTQGQRSDMAQNQSAFSSNTVKELVAGQLAGELTRAMRNTLNLDVIEFKGDNNWRQATVVLGKYITNDLFVSYQREIKMGRTYDTAPEQVTMEYEITKSLFFQATRGDEKDTGCDLIWKYEK